VSRGLGSILGGALSVIMVLLVEHECNVKLMTIIRRQQSLFIMNICGAKLGISGENAVIFKSTIKICVNLAGNVLINDY